MSEKVFVIQYGAYREENYIRLINTLNKYNINYDIIKSFPFVNKIVNYNDYISNQDISLLPNYVFPEKFIILGSVKLSNIVKQHYDKGTFFNENHDYEVYSKYYGDNLLNYDNKIIPITDVSNFLSNKNDYFLRPTKDTKTFNGGVYNYDKWLSIFNGIKGSVNYDPQENVVISSIKNIKKEVRFFILNDEIVTYSLYMFNGQMKYMPDLYIEDSAIEFVNKMINLFHLSDGYVMDIALIDDNIWKIIEINCLNCAGFYKSNLELLVEKLYNY